MICHSYICLQLWHGSTFSMDQPTCYKGATLKEKCVCLKVKRTDPGSN